MPTVVLSNHPGYPRAAGEAVPVRQIEAHARGDGRQWLARRHRRRLDRLPAKRRARRRRPRRRRARAPRQPAGALPLRPGVRRRARWHLSASRGTAAAIRDELLPLASIATPNRFELAWLTGLPVGDLAEARRAASALAVPTVLATSIDASDNRLATMLAKGEDAIACYVRRRSSAPHGTGDLLSAMFLGNHLNAFSLSYCARRSRLRRRCHHRR